MKWRKSRWDLWMHSEYRKSLDEAIEQGNKNRGIPTIDKNRYIVSELYNKDMFDIKGVVDIVAKEIGVSRYTIYNYIREAKINIKNSNKQ